MRVAVIGAGARFGLASYIRDGGAEVVVVADTDAAAEGRARSILPHDFRFVGSHHSIGEVDAAFVLTPDGTHAEIASDLLGRGIPVYLEKPMAISIEDCDRILDAAMRSRTKLYIGHNMRHMPFVQLMSRLVGDGAIGQVAAIWCRHFVGNGGDFYFKDWHAERSRGVGLLLQKASHDLDVIQMLAGAPADLVSGMGALAVYDRVTDRRDNSDRLMGTLASYDNWPPLSQTELNPIIDVEDLSHVQMRMANGVLATYNQCHFTPDYWRNYVVIGTEGRIENFGDTDGGVVRLWNRRGEYRPEGDIDYDIPVGDGTHGGADRSIVAEFLRFVSDGGPIAVSPSAARDAVAAGIRATESIRSGSTPLDVPALDAETRTYFESGQVGAR
ncbi:Gfo/Idh/MocA family protein [Microbacterium sp. Root61]|uniref:Gfo/Idh/MocA family protein n=1 Tax=Microbacterium sp. Root61 TaxID=1736570 RepID=UPI000A55F559|nr:Gfo/Idh/MocA family oxidoreductase [Microbacterium sp. Root61]